MKSAKESEAEMTVLMLPSDANPNGNVFGGVILKHIDLIAGIVAMRHSRKNCVTASIDRVNFLKPVYIGNALLLHARLNYVGKSSMEVEVKVEAEDLIEGTKRLAVTAFVTMVALDDEGKPTQVPELLLESEDDRRRFEEGRERMLRRRE